MEAFAEPVLDANAVVSVGGIRNLDVRYEAFAMTQVDALPVVGVDAVESAAGEWAPRDLGRESVSGRPHEGIDAVSPRLTGGMMENGAVVAIVGLLRGVPTCHPGTTVDPTGPQCFGWNGRRAGWRARGIGARRDCESHQQVRQKVDAASGVRTLNHEMPVDAVANAVAAQRAALAGRWSRLVGRTKFPTHVYGTAPPRHISILQHICQSFHSSPGDTK